MSRSSPRVSPIPQQSRESSAARRRRKAPHPSLVMKKDPAQQRATATVERILDVGAEVLADVGIASLSTNLICARGGMTPPALYRYFPNKYALLCELGRRLMERQDELVAKWITEESLTGSRADLERALMGLLLDTLEVTRQTKSGMWIMRALRAVPVLAQVRLQSHTAVTNAAGDLLRKCFPRADPAEVFLVNRITVELFYATVEMLCEEPQIDSEGVARIVSRMVASHVDRLRTPSKARRGAARKSHG